MSTLQTLGGPSAGQKRGPPDSARAHREFGEHRRTDHGLLGLRTKSAMEFTRVH